MSGLFVLLLILIFAGIAFIAIPIVALVSARRALGTAESLGRQIRRLKSEVETLQRNAKAESTTPPLAEAQVVAETTEVEASGTVLEPGPPAAQASAPVEPQEVQPPAASLTARTASTAKDEGFAQSSSSARPGQKSTFDIDWESFAGARLFAWVGGLALFLGIAFLVKYSVDQGLISPAVRVAIGFLVGAGCIWGGLRLRKTGYAVTSHVLSAAGVSILYAVTYAAYDLYSFIGAAVAFPLMILVTVIAFLLAEQQDSIYVALLGLAGGFLTPTLVSSGQDNPLGLFVYVGLLDLGLAAVALRRQWPILVPLSGVGTALMQLAWVGGYFHVSKVWTAVLILLIFPVFYAALVAYAQRSRRLNLLIEVTAGAMSLFSLCFAFYLCSFEQLGVRPGVIFSFVFLINLLLTALVILSDRFRSWQLAGGALTFLLLLNWTEAYLSVDLLEWGLAFFLLFAVLHSVFPVLLQKIRPVSQGPLMWGALYPLLMLLPVIYLILELTTVPFVVWFFVFLVDALALLTGVALAMFWIGPVALVLTLGAVWIGLLQLPDSTNLTGLLILMAAFSLAFFAVGVFLERKRNEEGEVWNQGAKNRLLSLHGFLSLPVLSALFPFLLLITVCINLELRNPVSIFGLALLFVILLLGVERFWRVEGLSLVALLSVALLQFAWYSFRFEPAHPALTLPWNAVFFAVFAVFPFLFIASMRGRRLPWLAAGFSGPIHFFLVYGVTSRSIGTAWIGLLPALFACIYLALLCRVIRISDSDGVGRSTRLSVFAGVTLFFVSLIFPVQWEREWLTIGWGLEGLALVWLFGRVPHAGLKRWGVALLAISFLRLAFNPAVLEYHERSGPPILNWYLYGYGVIVLCLVGAARFWQPRKERYYGVKVTSVLYSLAAVLAFLLLNIEIADFHSIGSSLTFEFGQSLGQDLTYSLGWAIFGFVLLLVGLRFGSRGARLASLGLISATTLKLFFYDLWSLDQLYRVGAFVGLAVILVLVSSLYQRHLGDQTRRPDDSEKSEGGPPSRKD